MLRVKSDFYFLPEKPCFTIKYREKGRKRNCVLSNCSKSRDTWKSYVRFHMYICSWSLYTPSYLLMASTFAFGPIYLPLIGIVFGRGELMGVWIKGGARGLRRRGGAILALWPFPDCVGACGLCPNLRARRARLAFRGYPACKLQWHFTCLWFRV